MKITFPFSRPGTAGVLIAAGLLAFIASARSQEYFASQTASDTEELRAAEMLILSSDASTAFDQQIARINRLRTEVRSGDGFLRGADEITLNLILDRKNARAILAQAFSQQYGSKVAPTAPVLDGVDRAVDALWQDLTRLAPRHSTPEGREVSQALNSALEAKLRASVPNATYVTARLIAKEWTVEKNGLGIPVARSIGGVVFYRLPDNPLVVCRELTIRRAYFEKPADGQPGEILFGDVRLQERV